MPGTPMDEILKQNRNLRKYNKNKSVEVEWYVLRDKNSILWSKKILSLYKKP